MTCDGVQNKHLVLLGVILIVVLYIFVEYHKLIQPSGQTVRRNLTDGKLYENATASFFKDISYDSKLTSLVDCAKIFDNDHKEIQKATNLTDIFFKASDILELYQQYTSDCHMFKRTRRYVTEALSPIERDFPIAYSIMTFKDADQTERLLRAIYRPQNIYCIHVDAKSVYDFQTLQAVAKCFDNVFLSTRRVYVGWNNYTSLEADIICMEELFKANKTWKYFINLTGQEFPLKTNLQIVKILRLLNGANDVQGIAKRINIERWANAGPVPANLTLYKGSNHVTLSRAAVDFILHNKIARDVLEWHKNVTFPGESFFNILNHNPQIGMPGAYKGTIPLSSEFPVMRKNGYPPEVDGKPFLSRYKVWLGESEYDCNGKFVRAICIQGVGDLYMLKKRKELFVNKLYQDYQPVALSCLEEMVFNRTRDEYNGISEFNLTYFENLDFYKNVVH